MVVSSVNTTGLIFESDDLPLLCNVTVVAPLEVESVVNITWFGPDGMIISDDTRYNSNADRSLLTLTTALSDNGTQYYCTAIVMGLVWQYLDLHLYIHQLLNHTIGLFLWKVHYT